MKKLLAITLACFFTSLISPTVFANETHDMLVLNVCPVKLGLILSPWTNETIILEPASVPVTIKMELDKIYTITTPGTYFAGSTQYYCDIKTTDHFSAVHHVDDGMDWMICKSAIHAIMPMQYFILLTCSF